MDSNAFPVDDLSKRVTNLAPAIHWIAGADRFWFKRQTPSGFDFVMVDAATGRQSPAFNHAAMRVALTTARPGVFEGSDLSITGLAFDKQGSSFVVETPYGSFACDLPVTTCSPCASPLRSDLVVSPDGRSAVLRRENDLWLRELSSGEERSLTHDGKPNFGYGDVDPSYDFQQVMRRRAGVPAPLAGVLWAPDSRFVIALRQDLRPFPERLLVTEYTPPDGAYAHAHFRRIPLPRDITSPDSRIVAIDTQASSVQSLAVDPQALNDLSLWYFAANVVWWSKDCRQFFMITANRGGSRFALNAVTLATGESREIIVETAATNVRLNPSPNGSRPNVHVFSKGDEVVWYSERSGHGHLYLHDGATGALKRQMTHGDWVVFDLLRVDESKRIAYFTAGPRGRDGNPYYRYLYCIGLDGGEPKLLTPESADHDFSNPYDISRLTGVSHTGSSAELAHRGSSISPSGLYIVDSNSTVDQPSKVVIRDISGDFIGGVVACDASALDATGWTPPERIVVKASDGATDLYGVVARPRNFNPSRKYPIIDVTYPGPQGRYAPRSFAEGIAGPSVMGNMQAFADAGFIVVAVDGRGTACRSRAFRDAFLHTEDAFGAADHVAAIQNLAAQRPYMDLERVGIVGVSYGGYGALRAMLLYPDFFKVAVSAEGPGHWLDMHMSISVERFFGVPSDSAEARAYYDVASNPQIANRLKGRLLLIFGGIDENVPLKHAFATIDAFIKADKNFDLLIVPDSSHAAYFEPYCVRRTLQYFVDYLS